MSFFSAWHLKEEFQFEIIGNFLYYLFFIFYNLSRGAFEYYYLGFLTLFTFIPGILIANASKKFKPILFVVAGIICLLGINTVLKTSDKFSFNPKKILIEMVMNIIGNEPFAIDGRGICHNYEGWRYLLKIYGRLPSRSYSDKLYGWIYSTEITDEKPVYTVTFSEDRIPLNEDVAADFSVKVGGYKAYIKKSD